MENKNYWRKENPRYIELECMIEQKQSRIDSGIITNDRTLKYANRSIKKWEIELSKTKKYIEQ